MIPVVVGAAHGSPMMEWWYEYTFSEEVLDSGRHITLYESSEYELRMLRWAAQEFDQFLFLKDSVRILDDGFWGYVDGVWNGAWLFGRPSCYLAVYDSATLLPILDSVPTVVDKKGSILWESRLHDLLDYPAIWPEVRDDSALRLERVGSTREMVIGNELIEKYKSTAHCAGCKTWPGSGLCEHYLQMFDENGIRR